MMNWTDLDRDVKQREVIRIKLRLPATKEGEETPVLDSNRVTAQWPAQHKVIKRSSAIAHLSVLYTGI